VVDAIEGQSDEAQRDLHDPLGFAALNANLPAHSRDELVYSST
jgi:hypothetical protein